MIILYNLREKWLLPFLFQFQDEKPEDFSPSKPENKTSTTCQGNISSSFYAERV